jgi:translation initiation factor 1 (eIF-1/SUI1)
MTDEKSNSSVPPPTPPTFDPATILKNASIEMKKLESEETPDLKELVRQLTELVKTLREGLGWKGVKVYLGNKNPSVREIERSFRQHMNWDFEKNGPVKRAPAPKVNEVVFGLTYLKRHFESVEKDSWTINLDALPQTDRGEDSADSTASLIQRDMKAKKDKEKKKKLKYKVHGSKKGGLPVSVEKRKHRKIVTVIRNVEGDAKRLLKDLKNELGTGGSVCEQAGQGGDVGKKKSKSSLKDDMEIVLQQIEIQGDHLKAITNFLSKKGGLRGVNTSSRKASKALGSKERDGKSSKKDGDRAGKELDNTKKKLPKGMPDLSKPLDNKAIKGMKPAILKLVLKARGLSIQGSKKELIKRVIESNS